MCDDKKKYKANNIYKESYSMKRPIAHIYTTIFLLPRSQNGQLRYIKEEHKRATFYIIYVFQDMQYNITLTHTPYVHTRIYSFLFDKKKEENIIFICLFILFIFSYLRHAREFNSNITNQ